MPDALSLHDALPIYGHKDFDLYPGVDGKGDLEAARELLEEAGVDDGFEFTLDIRSQPKMQAQAESIQQALEPLDVTEIGRASCRERGETWVEGGDVEKK